MTISAAGDAIQALTGLEAVRKRPGMYIGSTDASGLHGMLFEVLKNAAKHGTVRSAVRICINLEADGSVAVSDDAGGIPDRGNHKDGTPEIQKMITELYACGRNYSLWPSTSIGLEVVNALSESFVVRTSNGNGIFGLQCKRGKIYIPWQPIGKSVVTGTKITFKPDPEIFGKQSFEIPRIAKFCGEWVRLQSNCHFVVTDARGDNRTEMRLTSEQGEFDILRELSAGHRLLPERPFHLSLTCPIVGDAPRVLAAALAFVPRSFSRVASFVNFNASPDGGSHVTGFRNAVNDAFKDARIPSAERTRLRRGMVGVIHVLHPNPTWEGCIRSRVNTPELESLVRQALAPLLTGWMSDELLPHQAGPRRRKREPVGVAV